MQVHLHLKPHYHKPARLVATHDIGQKTHHSAGYYYSQTVLGLESLCWIVGRDY